MVRAVFEIHVINKYRTRVAAKIYYNKIKI